MPNKLDTTSSGLKFIKATSIPASGRSGRWISFPSASPDIDTDTGSLTASWCSASLEFIFSGTKLTLAVGEKTARKAQPNGGTPMIAVITASTRKDALADLSGWKTFDLEPGSDVVVFSEEEPGGRDEQRFVKIVLIDWAFVVEIKGFFIDEGGRIEPSLPSQSLAQEIPKILVIGDSISAGYAISLDKGGEKVPFGCLSTFPFVAQRALLSREMGRMGREVELDMIVYPGLCLVHPTEEEMEKGFHPGMVEAFFWESIWNNYRPSQTHVSSPSVLIIQLGNNDQSFKISPERFRDALIELVDALQTLSGDSIQHVWIVPPFPDADVPDYKEINKAMPSYLTALNEKFGKRIKFKICDIADGLTVEDTVDGAHPSLRVHEEIGRKLAVFIEREWF